MSFLNLLRGGVDTATRARAAGQQAETEHLPFLIQLQQLAQQRQAAMALNAANIAHLGAESKHLENQDNPTVQGSIEGAKEGAKVAPHLEEATRLKPIKVATAVETAQGEAPVKKELQANESNLTEGREARLAPIKAAATVDAYKARQDYGPLNPEEDTATIQLPRIGSSLKIMKGLPAPTARSAMTAHGGFWRNYLNSPEGQQWNQAATQAALAGALATEGPRGGQPDRVEYFKRTFVPSAGDDDRTAEQKLEALRQLMEGIKVKAGRGYKRLPADQQQIIEESLANTGAGGAGDILSKYPQIKPPTVKP